MLKGFSSFFFLYCGTWIMMEWVLSGNSSRMFWLLERKLASRKPQVFSFFNLRLTFNKGIRDCVCYYFLFQSILLQRWTVTFFGLCLTVFKRFTFDINCRKTYLNKRTQFCNQIVFKNQREKKSKFCMCQEPPTDDRHLRDDITSHAILNIRKYRWESIHCV